MPIRIKRNASPLIYPMTPVQVFWTLNKLTDSIPMIEKSWPKSGRCWIFQIEPDSMEDERCRYEDFLGVLGVSLKDAHPFDELMDFCGFSVGFADYHVAKNKDGNDVLMLDSVERHDLQCLDEDGNLVPVDFDDEEET